MTRFVSFLAVDLGAESGRCLVGRFDGNRLSLDETYRFANGPVRVLDTLYWDVLRLFSQVKTGLAKTAYEYQAELQSVGIDTWAVDFGLLDKTGSLIAHPIHYRDKRTEGMLEVAFQRVPREEIFGQTGIQFMRINTLYQLLAMAVAGSPQLDVAHHLLMMPDLFNFWLTGQEICEYTVATSTQCYDVRNRSWAYTLLDQLGIPGRIFGDVVPPGTVLGNLIPEVSEEIGVNNLAVIAPACHDAISSFACVSEEVDSYLTSGTWSALGADVPEPIINDATLDLSFTNQGGVNDRICLFKNIMGLWPIQECRRTWSQAGQTLSYDEMTDMAAKAPPFGALIDPDDSQFLDPGDMPARIYQYCEETGQSAPATRGEMVRTLLEALALKYRWVFENLESILDRRLRTMQIIGGGTKNQLLNQFVADALNRTIIAGPVEATAIGNVLMQMLALGHISSIQEGRELVKNSFETVVYMPANTEVWDEVYSRFRRLLKSPMLH